MAGGQDHAAQHNEHDEHSAKSYIIGYIISLVLTAIPVILTLSHAFSKIPLIVIGIIMAVLQIFVQLFFFMHIREGEGPKYHVMTLILGAVIVFAIVGASVWIMSFNSQVS